jgi:hypothetical protein
MSKVRVDPSVPELRAQTPPLPDYDQDKVDAAVLALLYLTLHQPSPYLAWPRFAWATLDRLYVKGMISDPKHTNTSVALTDEGVAEAAAAFQRLFSIDDNERSGVLLIAPGATLVVLTRSGRRTRGCSSQGTIRTRASTTSCGGGYPRSLVVATHVIPARGVVCSYFWRSNM